VAWLSMGNKKTIKESKNSYIETDTRILMVLMFVFVSEKKNLNGKNT
jgi:hypothetical protein